jgi:hypothetical protein
MEAYLPVAEKFATEHPIFATALASFGVTFIRLVLTACVIKVRPSAIVFRPKTIFPRREILFHKPFSNNVISNSAL